MCSSCYCTRQLLGGGGGGGGGGVEGGGGGAACVYCILFVSISVF